MDCNSNTFISLYSFPFSKTMFFEILLNSLIMFLSKKYNNLKFFYLLEL